MSAYNDIYYIAMPPYEEERLSPKPDNKTSRRGYGLERPAPGSSPFCFLNSELEEDKAENIRREITDVLVVDGGLLVKDYLKKEVSKYNIAGLGIHPSVYIDDDGKCLEVYWFLTIFDELDCWDRAKSEVVDVDYGDVEVSLLNANDIPKEILKFSLDAKVLDKIPEEQRMIFKMGGGVLMSNFFVHKKIVDVFVKNQVKGVRFFKVSEYKLGREFYP